MDYHQFVMAVHAAIDFIKAYLAQYLWW